MARKDHDRPALTRSSAFLLAMFGAGPLLPACDGDGSGQNGDATGACMVDNGLFEYCMEYRAPQKSTNDGCEQNGGQPLDSCPGGYVGSCETTLGSVTYTAYFYGDDVTSAMIQSVCAAGDDTGGTGAGGGAGRGGSAGQGGAGGTAANGGTSGSATGGSAGTPDPPLYGPATAVALGSTFGCAIVAYGRVACWGYAMSVLDEGGPIDSLEPAGVPGVRDARQITAGSVHACALLEDGTVRCWGWNSAGQIGNGTTTEAFSPAAVSLLEPAPNRLLKNVAAISAGAAHTCALLTNGHVVCWGASYGPGLPTTRSLAIEVDGLEDAVAIAAGYDHTCALLSDGRVKCWGSNASGQLATGTSSASETPVDSEELEDVRAISAGLKFGCALLGNGTARCWGDGGLGQLGDGKSSMAAFPVEVLELDDLRGVYTSSSAQYACALRPDGGVSCWGANSKGQLGDGTTLSSAVPVDVEDLSEAATAVALGHYTTCALLENGGIECWGMNDLGQFGDGTTTSSVKPTRVALPEE